MRTNYHKGRERKHYIKKKFHPSVWKWVVDYYRELKILAQKWTARRLRKEVMIEIAKVVGAPEIEKYLS
ncbi:MAG: hypothetical protein QW156_03290 [Candidatus Aenigmatarchaeota archaeon]